ncbi:tyrosine-protein phosphatase [Halochromatium sp.]
MIDLHCHMLPGIDDGSPDLSTSLAMARIAIADGIQVTACTPHIYPGLYENEADGIATAVSQFREALEREALDLTLTYGADIQIVPELLAGLRRGTHPTLNKSRYFLFEPPHHTVPVRFHESIHDTVAASYVPVITHPERLTWLDNEHYPWFVQAAQAGAWIQVTSGALTGRFGRQAQYWGERMLDDGLVHILATDSHDPHHRPPVLSEGRAVAAKWLGEAEADRLVTQRPQAILDNRAPAEVPPPPMLDPSAPKPQKAPNKRRSWLSKLFGDD